MRHRDDVAFHRGDLSIERYELVTAQTELGGFRVLESVQDRSDGYGEVVAHLGFVPVLGGIHDRESDRQEACGANAQDRPGDRELDHWITLTPAMPPSNTHSSFTGPVPEIAVVSPRNGNSGWSM